MLLCSGFCQHHQSMVVGDRVRLPQRERERAIKFNGEKKYKKQDKEKRTPLKLALCKDGCNSLNPIGA